MSAMSHGGKSDDVDAGKMGLYKLSEVRSQTLECPQNEKQMRSLQMSLVNNYLNGYTSKLSLQGE